LERIIKWQSVRSAEKQLHLVIIEVSQCEQQIENLNPIFKKSRFMRMGKRLARCSVPNVLKAFRKLGKVQEENGWLYRFFI